MAKDLRDAAFAREFLLASIDEGADLQLALWKVIRAMGVKEFTAKVRMASFRLRLSLAPLPGSRGGPQRDSAGRPA